MAFDSSNVTSAQVNAQAVDAAISLRGVHGERYGRMVEPNEGLDCVGLVERVAAIIGATVSIDPDWQTKGGDLPMLPVPVNQGQPGDVLVFDMGAGNTAFRRFQLGILRQGNVSDPRALFVGVPHAVAEVWLNAGPWKTSLIGAYRFIVMPARLVEDAAA